MPADIWRQVTSVAHAAGTTPNDALVRLASERLRDHQRALLLQRRADERWRAFAEPDAATTVVADHLSEEDLLELSRAFREDG